MSTDATAPGPTILSVGLDPTLIATSPTSQATFPSMDHDAVRAGAEASYRELHDLGCTVERCVLDHGATAEATYRAALAGRVYDQVVVGAGIRFDPALTHLLEMLVNVTGVLAPHAVIVFDTGPTTKADAVRRWYPHPTPVATVPGDDARAAEATRNGPACGSTVTTSARPSSGTGASRLDGPATAGRRRTPSGRTARCACRG